MVLLPGKPGMGSHEKAQEAQKAKAEKFEATDGTDFTDRERSGEGTDFLFGNQEIMRGRDWPRKGAQDAKKTGSGGKVGATDGTDFTDWGAVRIKFNNQIPDFFSVAFRCFLQRKMIAFLKSCWEIFFTKSGFCL